MCKCKRRLRQLAESTDELVIIIYKTKVMWGWRERQLLILGKIRSHAGEATLLYYMAKVWLVFRLS